MSAVHRFAAGVRAMGSTWSGGHLARQSAVDPGKEWIPPDAQAPGPWSLVRGAKVVPFQWRLTGSHQMVNRRLNSQSS